MCLHRNLEEGSQGLESSQNHIINGSVAGRSEIADLDAKIGISFLQTMLADDDRGYARRQDENMLDSIKKGKIRVQVILN